MKTKKSLLWLGWTLVVVLVLVFIFVSSPYLIDRFFSKTNVVLPPAVSYSEHIQRLSLAASSSIPVAEDNSEVIESEYDPPEAINLKVPFTAQAPLGEWTPLFKEACEEASLIMVAHYLQAEVLDSETATREINQLVDWQLSQWGEHRDLSIVEVRELAQKNYEFAHYLRLDDLDEMKIKYELSQGRPVIVPAKGRELGNPHFRSPGPVYHMLVIKGYMGDLFITNDPGTRYGADYTYPIDDLLAAIGDWEIDEVGEKKTGLVIY